MANLRDIPATKAASTLNAVDVRLVEAAKAETRRVDIAMSAFQGTASVRKADAHMGFSSGRGAALLGGTIGQGGIGFHDRPSTKADETPVHARVKALGMPAGPARDLLSLFATKSDTLPAGEPISADRFDVSAMLNISSDCAAEALGDLVSAGFLVERRDGALGVKLGFVLGAAVRA